MKTILISHNFSEISFSSMSYSLAHHLADLGHKVIFISHKPYFSKNLTIKKTEGSIIIYSWPTEKRPTTLKDFFWFSKLYLQYKPDIVIGHFVGSNISVSMSKLLSLGRVNTYVYYHTLSKQLLLDEKKTSLKQKVKFIRKKIFYKFFCDIIVCPSELAKKDLKLFHNVDKAIVLLNPMIDRFENKKNIENDFIIISYLGRLDNSKGVVDLIKAYLLYKKEFRHSKIILKIAGTGAQENEIKELSKNNSSIEYFGGISYDKIDDYLNECHFSIIPSKFDAFNVVGVESLMNQTPLLISNEVGLADYLTDGKECFKFDPNIDSMVSLFSRVENNIDYQVSMGFDARKTFLKKFSISTYCNKFSDVLL
ncbi:glycosyltransferase family 4 protein [Flavobacterium sp. I-SCBP12n]|uniref:Glycosyltransferase family 4 protein n=1 Tax=Flavobacterium pygoscelis TaxID=2893176 RepID=A0A9X2BLL4_9FLAO|nr:glycosyltransferase family 4 protein [Flavobacterium pygoscelis]MCK8141908.1 glycosyltransferase family 4 protein [Flavobacterium pygoscelis]